jgi:sugar phosphate isomerase/epimerase
MSGLLRDGDLVLAHHCMRTAGFEERVEAAAAGGFAAIGLNVREYERLLDTGSTPARLRAVLEANGVLLAEVEAIQGWDEPADGRPDGRREELAFAMADEFGVRHIVAVASIGGPLGAEPVKGFGALCDRAAAHGLLVALEPQACSAVTDLELALTIVRGADRSNGGLNVDAWHWTRGGWGLEALAGLRAEEVVVVQLDDGSAEPRSPDYLEDTIRYRQAPGEGEFDLVGFLRTLDGVGVRAPISLEVISDELEQLPPAVVAARLGDGTRAVLAAAGVTLAG